MGPISRQISQEISHKQSPGPNILHTLVLLSRRPLIGMTRSQKYRQTDLSDFGQRVDTHYVG